MIPSLGTLCPMLSILYSYSPILWGLCQMRPCVTLFYFLPFSMCGPRAFATPSGRFISSFSLCPSVNPHIFPLIYLGSGSIGGSFGRMSWSIGAHIYLEMSITELEVDKAQWKDILKIDESWKVDKAHWSWAFYDHSSSTLLDLVDRPTLEAY